GATVRTRDLSETPSNVKNPAWLAEQATTVAAEAGVGIKIWGTARGGGAGVVVGKGITYDTGGLSIKPRDAMLPMKTDMSGAAAVLAVLAACAELGVRRPVTGLLPLAENAVGASSYRPGDV